MTDQNNTDPTIRIPNGKTGKVVLVKSKLSSYNNNLWAVIESENLIGLDPGSVIPEQDIINLHIIPELSVVLKDTSVLDKIDLGK